MLVKLGTTLAVTVALSASAFAQSFGRPMADFGQDFRQPSRRAPNKSYVTAPATPQINPYAAQIGSTLPPAVYGGSSNNSYGRTLGSSYGGASSSGR
jgi:hypothetical protein